MKAVVLKKRNSNLFVGPSGYVQSLREAVPLPVAGVQIFVRDMANLGEYPLDYVTERFEVVHLDFGVNR